MGGETSLPEASHKQLLDALNAQISQAEKSWELFPAGADKDRFYDLLHHLVLRRDDLETYMAQPGGDDWDEDVSDDDDAGSPSGDDSVSVHSWGSQSHVSNASHVSTAFSYVEFPGNRSVFGGSASDQGDLRPQDEDGTSSVRSFHSQETFLSDGSSNPSQRSVTRGRRGKLTIIMLVNLVSRKFVFLRQRSHGAQGVRKDEGC